MPEPHATANNYAFIDGQNLNLGVRALGWHLDYRKFRLYLKNKYQVSSAFLFIGYVAGNQKLYTMLQKSGFILVYKPTVVHLANNKRIIKGNVDAELVLHAAAIEYANYDRAVIVTSDGDFTCLIQYLDENDKLLKVIAPNKRYSSLFQPFAEKITLLDSARHSLEIQKADISGRSKP